MSDISGHCVSGFEAVRSAFEANFAERGEKGASVAVFHGGRVVVDLWGGTSDGTRGWERDTLVMTYSTIKPAAASCAVLLWDRGELDLDAPVARYWPGFARAGKEAVTVRQLLSHQAGLLTLDDDLPTEALFDRGVVIAALERQEPMWPPGTKVGEHASFYGHLIDEVVRRVDGRSLHDFFAQEIAAPWELDLHIGLDNGDIRRAATLFGMAEAWPGGVTGDEGSVARRALGNPPGALDPEVVNSERWKRAAYPAINGYATGMGVARFFRGMLDGGILDGRRVFSEEACREATRVQASGDDVLLERHVEWGLGFFCQTEPPYFGHGGLGGSIGFAMRDIELCFGYVTNMMGEHDRADAVADAAESCAKQI